MPPACRPGRRPIGRSRWPFAERRKHGRLPHRRSAILFVRSPRAPDRSLLRQETRCRAKAEALGCEVAAVVVDAGEAAGERLLEAARAVGPGVFMVAESPTALSRKISHVPSILRARR